MGINARGEIRGPAIAFATLQCFNNDLALTLGNDQALSLLFRRRVSLGPSHRKR
jgi:hypothetical protein